MCHALGQAGIAEACAQALGRQVVDKNLVTPTTGRELSIRRDGRGVNRGHRDWHRPPIQLLRDLSHLPLGPLVNP